MLRNFLVAVLVSILSVGCAQAWPVMTNSVVVQVGTQASADFSVPQGETRVLEARFMAGTNAVVVTNMVADYLYQTDVGLPWYTAPCTVHSGGYVRLSWGPEYDDGSPRYIGWLRLLSGSNPTYRLKFDVRMIETPGFTPNATLLTQFPIDFDLLTWTNEPWWSTNDFTPSDTGRWTTAWEWGDHGTNGYATGTPVYVESDPVWESEKASYATGVPVYVESDPVFQAARVSGAIMTVGSVRVRGAISNKYVFVDGFPPSETLTPFFIPVGKGVGNRNYNDARYAFSNQGVNADTAYGWGDHSTNGYLTVESDPVWVAVSNTVTAGAALGATSVQVESDPGFAAVSNALTIAANNGQTAFGWGFWGTPTSSISWTDVSTNYIEEWREIASFPEAVQYPQFVKYSNEVYAVCGINTTNVYKYANNQWQKIGGPPYPSYGWAAGVLGDYLYIWGGQNSVGTPITNTFRYNGSTWTEMNGLPAARKKGLGFIITNTLHYFAGQDEDNILKSNLFSYSVANNIWIDDGGTSPARRHSSGGTVWNGSFYQFTGLQPTPSTNVWKYDGTNWARTPQEMTNNTAYLAVTVYKDKINIFGLGTTNYWHTFDATSLVLKAERTPISQTRPGVATIDGTIYLGGGTDRKNVYQYNYPVVVTNFWSISPNSSNGLVVRLNGTNMFLFDSTGIVPMVSNLNLGSLELPFKTGYFETNSIYLGSNKLSVAGGALQLNNMGVSAAETDPVWGGVSGAVVAAANNGQTAFGWGNHATAGYASTNPTYVWQGSAVVTGSHTEVVSGIASQIGTAVWLITNSATIQTGTGSVSVTSTGNYLVALSYDKLYAVNTGINPGSSVVFYEDRISDTQIVLWASCEAAGMESYFAWVSNIVAYYYDRSGMAPQSITNDAPGIVARVDPVSDFTTDVRRVINVASLVEYVDSQENEIALHAWDYTPGGDVRPDSRMFTVDQPMVQQGQITYLQSGDYYCQSYSATEWVSTPTGSVWKIGPSGNTAFEINGTNHGLHISSFSITGATGYLVISTNYVTSTPIIEHTADLLYPQWLTVSGQTMTDATTYWLGTVPISTNRGYYRAVSLLGESRIKSYYKHQMLGGLNLSGCPTDTNGLVTGDVWNSNGFLRIYP